MAYDITGDKLQQYGYQKNCIDDNNKIIASKRIFRVIYWRKLKKKNKFLNFSFVNAFVTKSILEEALPGH